MSSVQDATRSSHKNIWLSTSSNVLPPETSTSLFLTEITGGVVSLGICSFLEQAEKNSEPAKEAAIKSFSESLIQVITQSSCSLCTHTVLPERWPGVRSPANGGATFPLCVPIIGRQPSQLASISLWSILWNAFHSPSLHRRPQPLLFSMPGCERR